jgi:hypothetical protein
MEDPEYLRRKTASSYINDKWGASYAPETLAKLACVGGGPRFVKVGVYPLYRKEWLDEWVQARMSEPVAHNSELAAQSAS